MEPVAPYELRLTAEPGDIDQPGHGNNVVDLRWVQEAAIAHWTATAPASRRPTPTEPSAVPLAFY